jgi:hypothetical protein
MSILSIANKLPFFESITSRAPGDSLLISALKIISFTTITLILLIIPGSIVSKFTTTSKGLFSAQSSQSSPKSSNTTKPRKTTDKNDSIKKAASIFPTIKYEKIESTNKHVKACATDPNFTFYQNVNPTTGLPWNFNDQQQPVYFDTTTQAIFPNVVSTAASFAIADPTTFYQAVPLESVPEQLAFSVQQEQQPLPILSRQSSVSRPRLLSQDESIITGGSDYALTPPEMDDVSLKHAYSSSPEESFNYLPSDPISSSGQVFVNDSVTIMSNDGSPNVPNIGVEPYVEQLESYQWGKPMVTEAGVDSYDAQHPLKYFVAGQMQPMQSVPEIELQQQYSPVGQPIAINVAHMHPLQQYQQLQQLQQLQQSEQLQQYFQHLQHSSHAHHPTLIPYVAQFAPMISMKHGGFIPDYEHLSNFSDKSKHPFSCPHCPSSFRLRGYLTRHMKKHAIKKAYSCPFYDCNDKSPCHPSGGFSRRDTYKTHLKARHFLYPAGTRSEHRSKVSGVCSGCGEKFDSNEKWVEEHIHNGKCAGLAEMEKKRELEEQQASCEPQLLESQYQEY